MRGLVLDYVIVLVSACGLVGCMDWQAATPVAAIAVEETQAAEPVEPIQVAATDWPWWRGPNSNGVANCDSAPLTWSETQNVLWKTPVPGRGHSSPTVVGDRIYLTTADEQANIQSVLAYDKSTGKQLWKTDVHRGGFDDKAHRENSRASGCVACDGKRLFVAFLNHGAVWVTALDLDGNQLWQTNAGHFDSHWGYGASPILYKSLVIISADHEGGGYLAAVHRKTGDIVWRTSRPAYQSYSSAVVGQVDGEDQLMISGCDEVCSYDPSTGKELWCVKGTTEVTCATMVWSDDLAFASGGFPGSETLAVKGDGSGKVVWRNKVKIYVPSMLVHKGFLYAVNDGRAYCWNAQTGKTMWQHRLGSEISRASPVLVGDHIYYLNVKGTMYVFKANPEKFELVAENQLGDETYATPVVCDGCLYLRVADNDGDSRRETLYCIGDSAITEQ